MSQPYIPRGARCARRGCRAHATHDVTFADQPGVVWALCRECAISGARGGSFTAHRIAPDVWTWNDTVRWSRRRLSARSKAA